MGKNKEEEVDVTVVIEGGVADVCVNRDGIKVEVRDYDVDGDDEGEFIWTDSNGDKCWRYFVE